MSCCAGGGRLLKTVLCRHDKGGQVVVKVDSLGHASVQCIPAQSRHILVMGQICECSCDAGNAQAHGVIRSCLLV